MSDELVRALQPPDSVSLPRTNARTNASGGRVRSSDPVAAQVDPDGREYVVDVPGGGVFIVRTFDEAIAIASLWRTRQPSISSRPRVG
jgi:hypothetical protein